MKSHVFLHGHKSADQILPGNEQPRHHQPSGAGHRRRPHPPRRAVDGAGGCPGDQAALHLPTIPDHAPRHRLRHGVDHAQNPERAAGPRPGLHRSVEDPVDAELQRLARLGCSEAGEGPAGDACGGAGEVGDAGAEDEVLAPVAAAVEGLLWEEELGGGGDVVEGPGGAVEEEVGAGRGAVEIVEVSEWVVGAGGVAGDGGIGGGGRHVSGGGGGGRRRREGREGFRLVPACFFN